MSEEKKDEKNPTFEEMKEEIIQLTDLAQAVNARCFFLRELLKQQDSIYNNLKVNKNDESTNVRSK